MAIKPQGLDQQDSLVAKALACKSNGLTSILDPTIPHKGGRSDCLQKHIVAQHILSMLAHYTYTKIIKKVFLKKWPTSSSKTLPFKGSTIFPKSITSWGLSAQIHEPMEDISNSNPNKILRVGRIQVQTQQVLMHSWTRTTKPAFQSLIPELLKSFGQSPSSPFLWHQMNFPV